jgi:phosphonate transport system permease protein
MSAALQSWERFSSGERLARFSVYLFFVAALVLSARHVEIIPEFLLDAPEQMRDLFTRMWPVDVASYSQHIHAALVDTIHIASLGTLMALVMAVPVALLAAHNITPFYALNYAAKLILVASRSVNSLVWALLFVAVFGPGPLAGTLAIAFRSIGFVGKLLSEALEEAAPGPIEALRAVGAPQASVLSKGFWPQVKPAFFSIALFRWDINIRESSVLGLVGAGGIGMALDAALNLFQWERVAMILLCILTVVVIAEILVTQIRKRVL